MAIWTKQNMCEIAARELMKKSPCYANLGIGLPTLVAQHVPKDAHVILHSENGMLGIGPFPSDLSQVDPEIINAGKQTITELPCTCYVDSAMSFNIIRGGHLDLTILGAFQVSKCGDLANWTIPGEKIKGMGGAMDLVRGVKKVIVMMTHCSKDGSPKILDKCTMPLTGAKVVDEIITDMGKFVIDGDELYLVEKPEDLSIEEIAAKTGCHFEVSLAS